jgi:hypothetical protein
MGSDVKKNGKGIGENGFVRGAASLVVSSYTLDSVFAL